MAMWELRRALRYGSEHVGYVEGEVKAETVARAEIEANGKVGRITFVDRQQRILYYDVHEELA